MKLLTVAEMIEQEHAAIAKGMSVSMLMNRAGLGLAEVIRQRVKILGLQKVEVVALVGNGNNGGDALIALMELARQGWAAKVIYLADRGGVDNLCAQVLAMGIPVIAANEMENGSELAKFLSGANLVLDGVLGTGFKGEMRHELARRLSAITKAFSWMPTRPYVVAVDCPSGANCDTGEVAPETLHADLTVCMAACKQGLLRQPAFGLCGEIASVGIGIEVSDGASGRLEVVEATDVRNILPLRQWDAHKGKSGNVIICGGSAEYVGAPVLAGMGAYAVGSGLVRLAVPAFIQQAFASKLPEAIWLLMPADDGSMEETGAALLRQTVENANVLVFGPGMGRQYSAQRLAHQYFGNLVAQIPTIRPIGFGLGNTTNKMNQPSSFAHPPVVIDADGIRNLSGMEGWWKALPAGSVLTPHPGEMAGLTGMATADVQADRVGIASRFAKKWGCSVILKGAQSVIGGPDGRIALIPISAPALAKAGSGDVLAGIVAGLMAQGLVGYDAAWCGAWLHAMAGVDMANQQGNEKTPTASDIVQSLKRVFEKINR